MSNQHSALAPRIDSLVLRAWGERVRVVSTSPFAGDASSRSYLRITLDGRTPATAVIMIQSGSGLSISSDELAVFTDPMPEIPFLNVQRYLRSAGVAVPEVYAADPDLVLLEDVGDVMLWDAVRGVHAEGVLKSYGAAIDELVRLQRAGEEHPDPACIAFKQRFDARLFQWEFEHFLEFGFTGRSVSKEDVATLRREFETLSIGLAAMPLTLAHRDYHSWNLFVQDGRIRVIDFQDALLAPVAYDLATLLNDRATPSVVTPALERKLVAYFVERRSESGEAPGLEAFLPAYYRFLLQKSLKIVGRFHYLEQVKGRRGYVAMLPDTLATLRRCLDHLPDLGSVRKALSRSFPELS